MRILRVCVVAALSVVLAQKPPADEMHRLLDALSGDWNVTETFARSALFPNGGARTGIARITPGPGGLSLFEDYHSDGSAGLLDLRATIWYDQPGATYRVLICANGRSGCRLRGTARWVGREFINEYEETVEGKKLRFQDRFFDITSRSFTLVMEGALPGEPLNGHAKMQALVTTKYEKK